MDGEPIQVCHAIRFEDDRHFVLGNCKSERFGKALGVHNTCIHFVVKTGRNEENFDGLLICKFLNVFTFYELCVKDMSMAVKMILQI